MAEGQSVASAAPAGEAELRPLQIEMNGINVITDSERKGRPRELFWPWFAANVSVLGLSYGSFVLGFGISFWQALWVSVAGIIISFLLCGFVAIAGKRGSAPTMVLRSEEHTSELQSRRDLVCRLLLEKKKKLK